MTNHTPRDTPQDRLAAWAAMNGPEILTAHVSALADTVAAHTGQLVRLRNDVAEARNAADILHPSEEALEVVAAEVGLGLGHAVGASILAHEASSAHTDEAERLAAIEGAITDLREEMAKLWAVWAGHELDATKHAQGCDLLHGGERS